MRFGEILSNAWEDYKKNFKSIFNFMFIFRGIPLLIFTLFNIFFIYSDKNVYNLFIEKITEETVLPWNYLIISWIFVLGIMLLFLFVSGALTSLSIRKSKFSPKELVKEGKSVFSKYFLYSLISLIFIFLLLLLFIIPGLIFAIYWLFGSYVLFDQKTSILQSLKKSRQLVKGKWWKIFGSLILIILISAGISLIISLIPEIINFLTKIYPSKTSLMISLILEAISGFLTELVALPLPILFFKNFYLDLKKDKKK